MRLPARKWVRWLLAALATGLLAVIVLATWLVTTEAGLRRSVAIVESLDKVKIRIEGASGRLIGPLAITSIEIEHPRASIRIAGLQADYEPLEILAGRISAEAVRVSDATIRLRPPSGPSRPPSFMPGWLAVVIDEARVARLLIVAPNGTEVPFRDIRGSAKLSKNRIEFDDVRVSSTGWAVAGASGSLYARDPVALDVNTAWSLSDERLVAGIAHAVGDLDRLLVDAHVTAPGIGRVTAEVRNLRENLAWQGKAAIETLDLTQWIANPPFGPLRAELAINGDRSHYAAQGIVLGNGLPEAGVRVDTRASYADRVVTIESVALETGPASFIHANGTMTVAEELSYDVSATWTGFRWPLTGNAVLTSPRGSLDARGWTEFDYRVSGDFQPAGGPHIAGNAAGRFTTGEITVDESTWRVARWPRFAKRQARPRGDPGLVRVGPCGGHRSIEAEERTTGPACLRFQGRRFWLRREIHLVREYRKSLGTVSRAAGERQRRREARQGPDRVPGRQAGARAGATRDRRRTRPCRQPRRARRCRKISPPSFRNSAVG